MESCGKEQNGEFYQIHLRCFIDNNSNLKKGRQRGRYLYHVCPIVRFGAESTSCDNDSMHRLKRIEN